ncbi:hypothetical protein QOZ94_003037 [Xanthobacter agilis]|uniref:Uncharacterized protein n=1 Tax=Xanthobacter agilis TaxID=47492 RepID=A0ABU0LGL0_XANAG|nr:hypothetical protein [Xanthobacter agilis]
MRYRLTLLAGGGFAVFGGLSLWAMWSSRLVLL